MKIEKYLDLFVPIAIHWIQIEIVMGEVSFLSTEWTPFPNKSQQRQTKKSMKQ
jgi:hypothetical protein